jgi:hypothetical protein
VIALFLAIVMMAVDGDSTCKDTAAAAANDSAPVTAAASDNTAGTKTAADRPAESAASTVSLSGMLALDEVCAEIEKQTGNRIIDYRQQLGQQSENPHFKLDVKNAPFWEAVDALLDSTKMTVHDYSGHDGLAIVNRGEDELPRRGRAAYVGPLRLEVERIVAERTPGLKTDHSLKLILAIAWEPRLTPLAITQRTAQLQAIDDQGHALPFADPQATLEAPVGVGGGPGAELVLQLNPPPRSVNAIASLKGTLNLALPGNMETFEFDQLTAAVQLDFKPIEQKKEVVTVRLDQIRKNNDVWEVLTHVSLDNAAQTIPFQQAGMTPNDAYILGPNHHRLDNAGYHFTRKTGNELGIVYQFDQLPENLTGYTFVYKGLSSVHLLPVDYELKNIPLP